MAALVTEPRGTAVSAVNGVFVRASAVPVCTLRVCVPVCTASWAPGTRWTRARESRRLRNSWCEGIDGLSAAGAAVGYGMGR
ncbi:hypothetical protein SGLAM104S_10595 [Streptomyces glaucescens]